MSEKEYNLYDAIELNIIEQIHKYKPEITVTDAAVRGDWPDYPFIVYDLVDDYEKTTFADNENENFLIRVQLKVVSDNNNEAKSLGLWLRKLFFLRQPKYDLAKLGMAAVSSQPVPPVEKYLEVAWQFSSGVLYTFMVQDGFVDDTQPGTLLDVNPTYTIKGE
ncbi:phage neck terminator protein [Secundilactobacillus kimchicus]|uniref:phage neck terminator protein n=1 Tax=Secundilactobacillus kimchicus TaxID=528209 RepID=UPI0024A9F260|nr:hypothetical protein [Secundilactobacillus kimchicus]